MNEKLLQYLWNFKIFKNFDFIDTEGNTLEIMDFGKWNHDSGPDFLLAKIKTGNIILAGNIEIHVKSSDWILHQHSKDTAYKNVILHAVYEKDVDIEELSFRKVPTLELKSFIDHHILSKYESLLKKNTFIPCENIFDPSQIPFQFSEESLLKKLEDKTNQIQESLNTFKNNYEAVMFHFLAYAFGLKVNAVIFKQMMESIDFKIFQKVANNENQMHALFYGISGWLDPPVDEQTENWKKEFEFLKNKFQLSEIKYHPKFLRLRPANFPTIRLSQLAKLYCQKPNIFSKIIDAKSKKELFDIFGNIQAHSYWDNRYSFGKISKERYEKILTEDFIERIILNAALPIKYIYHRANKENAADEILEIYRSLQPEKNNLVSLWKDLGVDIENALDSQAYIYHFKNVCENKKCLNCSIGFQLLKNTSLPT